MKILSRDGGMQTRCPIVMIFRCRRGLVHRTSGKEQHRMLRKSPNQREEFHSRSLQNAIYFFYLISHCLPDLSVLLCARLLTGSCQRTFGELDSETFALDAPWPRGRSIGKWRSAFGSGHYGYILVPGTGLPEDRQCGVWLQSLVLTRW